MNILGRWITNGTDRPFYLRRTLNLLKKPVSAHAMVCGLGQCVFYANGKRISDHEMDPGWTEPDFDDSSWENTGRIIREVTVMI